MTRTLFAVASLALLASMPFPASTALAKGSSQGLTRSGVECETGSFVTICYAATRSDCAQAVTAHIRETGRNSIFTPRCEQLADGRWIFLLPL